MVGKDASCLECWMGGWFKTGGYIYFLNDEDDDCILAMCQILRRCKR